MSIFGNLFKKNKPQPIANPTFGNPYTGNQTPTVAPKGKSLIAFPENFTVVDVETTGFSPTTDDIIEISALRVRDGKVVDSFSSLVRLQTHTFLEKSVIDKTGITFGMLATAPAAEQVFPAARLFIGSDIVVGHSVSFDVDFLYNKFMSTMRVNFTNDYVDTLRISRKVFPDLRRHRLIDVAKKIGYSPDVSHRALADCQTTLAVYNALRERVRQTVGIDVFIARSSRESYTIPRDKVDLRAITPKTDTFDETHPLYGKHCVFTGALEKMARVEAAQLVVDVGGICDNNVTKKTNFLILGNNDYCKTIKDGKSSKQKKAEEYKELGLDIEIISENAFYEIFEKQK